MEKKDKLKWGKHLIELTIKIMFLIILIAFAQFILLITVDHNNLPSLLTNYNNGHANLFPILVFIFLINGLILYLGILQNISEN